MPRLPRIQAPGLSYHIHSRGNGGMDIYLDDVDRATFLDILAEVVQAHAIRCHAYCQMTNHYHLVVTTLEANISHAMHELNGDYGHWWNRRHRRTGHVFQGRFGAQLVQEEDYLLTCCRYAVRNPVRGHLVDRAGQWLWSSYRATAGLVDVPSFLYQETLFGILGADRETIGMRYRNFVDEPNDDAARLRGVRIIGDTDFVQRFERQQRTARPAVRRSAGWSAPTLESIFAGLATRAERNAGAARARAAGYALAEIARHLEMHVSTVSKMVAAAGQSPDERGRVPDPGGFEESGA